MGGESRPLSDVLVLFDWNGTLVADTDRATAATNRILRQRGLAPLDPAGFAQRWRLPLTDFFADLGVAPPDVAAAEAEWSEQVAAARERAEPRPGAFEVISWLGVQGARVGIVTAASHTALGADLRRFEMQNLFHMVIAGVSSKVRPLVIERSARAFAAYVGDTEHDISAAIAADYVAIGISGGYTPTARLGAAGAHAVIDELAELPRVLAEWIPHPRQDTPTPTQTGGHLP